VTTIKVSKMTSHYEGTVQLFADNVRDYQSYSSFLSKLLTLHLITTSSISCTI